MFNLQKCPIFVGNCIGELYLVVIYKGLVCIGYVALHKTVCHSCYNLAHSNSDEGRYETISHLDNLSLCKH